MKLSNLFRPKWRHSDAGVRMAALATIHDRRMLQRIATSSQDERLRLEAAHRLNDFSLLMRLVRSAVHADIRFEAALLVCDETTLAAMALDAWHINQGEMAVIHIDNALLLRRLAHSAHQDAIRLAAAQKLNDPGLLHQVAQSSNDIHIRWRVALHLDNPQLLADVACYKPDDIRLAELRSKARCAFQDHLDRRQRQGDKATIGNIIQTVIHPALKIDAFLKLLPQDITPDLIFHLSHQDYCLANDKAVIQMLEKIERSGWQVQQSTQSIACRLCHGAGKYPLRSIAAGSSHLAHDLSICQGCDGLGQQITTIVTCKHPHHREVIFHLPTNALSLSQLTVHK